MAQLVHELIERCRAGDREAAGELVRRFQRWALELAEAIVGDAQLAEDAVQLAFVRALRCLGSLREPAAFAGWLRQIVRSECDHLMRRQRHETVGEAVPWLAECAPGDGPARQLEMEECRQLVRDALRQLPRGQREAAELYYLQERSCQEAARILQVPVGTVKRRLHEARNDLRQILRDAAEEYGKPKPPASPNTGMPL